MKRLDLSCKRIIGSCLECIREHQREMGMSGPLPTKCPSTKTPIENYHDVNEDCPLPDAQETEDHD